MIELIRLSDGRRASRADVAKRRSARSLPGKKVPRERTAGSARSVAQRRTRTGRMLGVGTWIARREANHLGRAVFVAPPAIRRFHRLTNELDRKRRRGRTR